MREYTFLERREIIRKYELEIQDNFLPVGGMMGDPYSLEGKVIASHIAVEIWRETNYREHLASLEGDVGKWFDSLGLYVRAVLFRWLHVVGACPLEMFVALGYDVGEAWTICQEIDEKTREVLTAEE